MSWTVSTFGSSSRRWSARLLLCGTLLAVWLVGLVQESPVVAADQVRDAWTSSRVKGSPEPPLPLSLEPAFPALKFNDPMHVRWQADLKRYFVCELGGKVWSFPDDPDVATADSVVDFKASLKSFDAETISGFDSLYSIVFDPDFKSNRFIYACIILKGKTGGKLLPDGSRISRFRMTQDATPQIDIASELPIITWVAGGHNGCDLAFDNDGCLLITTGDAADPSPPDRLDTGQDISDLLSSVLRIDVRGATSQQPYKVPEDNPFKNTPNARPEVWAYGFRNPWRLSVDPETSQVWLGDVGWEKWELIHRVESGGNYGWSVREGDELLRPNASLGPTPIRRTRVALSHADAASITGGFVYRGHKLPQIRGEYLFGDWITGRIWSVPLDDTSPHREVASDQLRIIAFAPDRDGEPLVVNHLTNTTLFRLTANSAYAKELAATRSFPRLLSQTGLFSDVKKYVFAKGVRRFSISQPQWNDGAFADHALALPDLAQVTVFNEPQPVGAIAMFNSRLHYPAGTVLVKTISLPMPSANAPSGETRPAASDRSSARRIETQLLHFDGRLWHGTSYLWNERQSDAELAPAEGLELTLPVESGQRWRVHSRTECLQCHNPWPETTLAFTPEQLHRPEAGDNSEWLKLVHEGYVVTKDRQNKPIEPTRCVRRALYSTEAEDDNDEKRVDRIAQRARAYLHANCAHCHQNGAGAAVDLSLKISDDVKAMKVIDIAPTKGNFGLRSNKLVATGDSVGSALIYRIAASSIGRMPHIGSKEVDFNGVVLVSDWIDSLAQPNINRTPPPVKADPAEFEFEQRAGELIELTAASSTSTASEEQREAVIRKALSLAIDMARAKSGRSLSHQRPSSISDRTLASLAGSPDPLVSTLFEAHIPARQRQRRLGPGATFAEVADLTGHAAAGEAWFFDTARSQCAKCHRVGSRGIQVGPDLTEIGKKLSPAQLFEALADPSRVVDAKYQSHIVVLEEGKVVTGLLDKESSSHLILITPQGERAQIDVADIESRQLDTKSLMPTGLTGELTAQQAADLLAYLSSLKSN